MYQEGQLLKFSNFVFKNGLAIRDCLKKASNIRRKYIKWL